MTHAEVCVHACACAKALRPVCSSLPLRQSAKGWCEGRRRPEVGWGLPLEDGVGD